MASSPMIRCAGQRPVPGSYRSAPQYELSGRSRRSSNVLRHVHKTKSPDREILRDSPGAVHERDCRGVTRSREYVHDFRLVPTRRYATGDYAADLCRAVALRRSPAAHRIIGDDANAPADVFGRNRVRSPLNRACACRRSRERARNLDQRKRQRKTNAPDRVRLRFGRVRFSLNVQGLRRRTSGSSRALVIRARNAARLRAWLRLAARLVARLRPWLRLTARFRCAAPHAAAPCAVHCVARCGGARPAVATITTWPPTSLDDAGSSRRGG